MDISGMPLLQGLRLSNNPICSLPENMKYLSVLKQLDLERCTRLRTLPELPMTLQALSIYGCKSLQMATNLPNLLNSLMLSTYGCVKLVQVQELFKLEPIGKFDSEMIETLGLAQLESMESLEVELFNNLTLTKTKAPVIQGLYECGIYSIFLPGNEVPGWFSIKNRGSSIAFEVPSLPNVRIQGLNVCISYALALDYMKSKWMYECIRISNKTKGLKWTYRPAFTGIAEEGKDMIWLSDWKIGDQLMEGGDEVTVSVKMEENYQLKEFGIRIVYDEQEERVTQNNKSDEQEEKITEHNTAYPCPEKGIDLSAYEMRAGEYFLCNHDEYTRSDYYSRIAGLPSDFVETCWCGFQCEIHTKQY